MKCSERRVVEERLQIGGVAMLQVLIRLQSKSNTSDGYCTIPLSSHRLAEVKEERSLVVVILSFTQLQLKDTRLHQVHAVYYSGEGKSGGGGRVFVAPGYHLTVRYYTGELATVRRYCFRVEG